MSCDDLGSPGIDDYYGNGLLNTRKLLSNSETPEIAITTPFDHEGMNGEFDIIGTVKSPRFMRYSVMYTNEDISTALSWRDVATHSNTPNFITVQKDNELLAHFSFSSQFPDGDYKIRVRVETTDGHAYNYTRAVRIDRSAPVLESGTVTSQVRYHGENLYYYVQAKFNELVNLTVLCRTSNGEIFEGYSVTSDTLQTVKLPSNVPEGVIDIKLKAWNMSNLPFESEWLPQFMTVDYSSIPVTGYDNVQMNTAWVPVNQTMDFDLDGITEFAAMDLPNFGIGTVRIFQLQNGLPIARHQFPNAFWPLDMGNTNDYGPEILGLYQNTARLYETPVGQLYPFYNAMWTLSNVAGGIFADYNLSGHQGLVLVRDLAERRVVQLYQRSDTTFVARNQLVNESPVNPGSRNTFVPKVACDNLDGDTFPDILTADTEGDVMIFEAYTPLTQAMTWSTRLPVANTYQLTTGDFNGDGAKDFVVGG
jgi:hypothetical protein